LAGERGAGERREALKEVLAQTRGCVRCAELAATRKTVVFGAGNADAELMFVGEAPGASEDEQGVPFVGRAGKLLATLLEEISMERADVFIANVLKCRPPQNRDPQPLEIENCREYLFTQVELIEPAVICTLGNFATKLLRGDPAGITRVHGRPEVILLGRRAVRLYPIFHPAAALYTPRMLETLREDFSRLPALLALGPPEQPADVPLSTQATSAPASSAEVPSAQASSAEAPPELLAVEGAGRPPGQPPGHGPGPDSERPGVPEAPAEAGQPGQLGLF
jgi:DNA polymerase